KVVDPRTGLLGPSLVTIEPLAKGPERHAGGFADQGLVSGLVNHKAVYSVEELLVGSRLQRCRRPSPRSSTGGHGLRRGDVLAIDVSDRCRLTIIGVIAVQVEVHLWYLRPHGTHGDLVVLLHLHAIGYECT